MNEKEIIAKEGFSSFVNSKQKEGHVFISAKTAEELVVKIKRSFIYLKDELFSVEPGGYGLELAGLTQEEGQLKQYFRIVKSDTPTPVYIYEILADSRNIVDRITEFSKYILIRHLSDPVNFQWGRSIYREDNRILRPVLVAI